MAEINKNSEVVRVDKEVIDQAAALAVLSAMEDIVFDEGMRLCATAGVDPAHRIDATDVRKLGIAARWEGQPRQ